MGDGSGMGSFLERHLMQMQKSREAARDHQAALRHWFLNSSPGEYYEFPETPKTEGGLGDGDGGSGTP